MKKVKITEHNLCIPINKTIHLTWDELDNKVTIQEPTNIKVIISCTELQRRTFDERSYIDKLKKIPNVVDVKLAYEIEKPLHIRCASITESKSAVDKFIKYAEVDKINYDKELLDKIDYLEKSQEIKYVTPKHTFTLLKIKLRGAIGIKNGSGKDEVEVDFSKLPDGIIALCGENGKGKTTLIENCQPYPRMFSRTGTLQNHFYLKDSLRSLLYVDEEGTYYLIEMMIDGKSNNGKVKYFVQTGKDVNNLTAVPECTGNETPYTDWVIKNFGPIELFLRTAFYAKEETKGIPDISRATKGEKKALFSTLVGIDNIKELGLSARAKAKDLEKDIIHTSALVTDVDFEKCIKDSKNKLYTVKDSITRNMAELTASKERLKGYKTKLDSFNSSKLSELKSDLDFKTKLYNEKVVSFKTVSTYESNKASYDNALSYFEASTKAKETLDNYIKEVYNPLKNEYSLLNNELAGVVISLEKEESRLSIFKEHASLEVDDKCPTCGHKLSQENLAVIEDEVNHNKEKVEEYCESIAILKNKKEALTKKLQEHKFVKASKEAEKLESIYKKKVSYCSLYDYNTIMREKFAYENITGKDTLKTDIKTLEDSIAAIENEISRFNEENESVLKLPGLIEKEEADIYIYESELRKLHVREGELNKEIEDYTTAYERASEAERKFNSLLKEQNDWKIIDKAFGADGIQALELEALSPEIETITNNILYSAYGDRFKVSFQTLHLGSNGNYIEDFEILVEDRGITKPLEWVSSGEAVWIKAALYNAFSIVRMNNTGVAIKTIFADEVDGSLDSESRMRYLKMMETAHQECGAVQTIMITHSQELKDSIPSRLDF